MKREDISNIQLRIGDWDKIKGFVTITFTNGLSIDSVKVIDGVNGYFIGMPSIQRRNKETHKNEYQDCVRLSREDRDVLTEIVLEAYHNAKGRNDNNENNRNGDNSNEQYKSCW